MAMQIEKNFPASKFLYSLGAAVHLLKPLTKEPIHRRWQRRERDTWQALTERFTGKMNLGVRAGISSTFEDGTHLVVVDLDVKSPDPWHLQEALETCAKFFPEIKKAPFALSGRGNGSRHFYLRSCNKKTRIELISRSEEKCEVYIGKEIKERPCWEIQLLGEGSQVVLPGSIHPDTMQQYVWGKQPKKLQDLPLMTYEQAEVNEKADSQQKRRRFRLVPVTVWDFGWTAADIEAIEDGVNVVDRSSEIYRLMKLAIERGASDDALLTIFSDPTYYLGKTAYDPKHTNSKHRAVAMNWLDRFCLRPARIEAEGNTVDFDFSEMLEAKPEAPGQVKGPTRKKPSNPQTVGLPGLAGEDWEDGLEIGYGVGWQPFIKSNFHNIKLILTERCGRRPFIRLDVFRSAVFWAESTPWGTKAGEMLSDGNQDAIAIKAWLVEHYKMDPRVGVIEEVLEHLSRKHQYHPVKEYLLPLEKKWDGVKRVEFLFEKYMGCTMDRRYQGYAARLFLVNGMVRRIMEPGCFFRHVIILEGAQLLGKSSFARDLSVPWFLDSIPNMQDKDAQSNLRGAWLCEIGELSAMHRSTIEAVKVYIAKREDSFRPHFGKRRIDVPRSVVFMGTTDNELYLQDPTGNTRWLPVECKKYDQEALLRDRDQIFAEAMHLYRTEPQMLQRLDADFLKIAEGVQDTRMVEDEIDLIKERVSDWLENDPRERFTMNELYNLPLSGMAQTQPMMKKIAMALRKMGFERHHSRNGKIWSRIKSKN